MKTSIFVRILIGAMVPTICVFIVLIFAINSIIDYNNEKSTLESARNTAFQISNQVNQKLHSITVLQTHISSGLASIRFDQPDAKDNADALLRTYQQSSSDIYSAWFSFDPTVFPDGLPYFKAEHRDTSEEWTRKTVELGKRLVAAQEAPLWYVEPFLTGEMYFNVLGRHRMAGDLEAEPTLTLSSPIIQNGKTIGVVGVDLLYEDGVAHYDLSNNEEHILLFSAEGIVLFSEDKAEIGKKIEELASFEDKKEAIDALKEDKVWQDIIYSSFFQEDAISTLYPFYILDESEEFFLYQEIPASDAMGIFSTSMDVIYFVIIIGLILLSVVVFLTTNGIVVRIRGISERFHIVADSEKEVVHIDASVNEKPSNITELYVLEKSIETVVEQLNKVQASKIKALEAELEKEKLIDAAKMKNNFFAAMSHEIRTPMNAILGISEIILIDDNLPPIERGYVEDIKVSASSLLGIINNIMDISKMDNTTNFLFPANYNFPAMIDNISSMMGHTAEKDGLEFNTKISGDIPEVLYGDEFRLRQMLLNLLSNAIKYTDKGFVSLEIRASDDKILFDVIDSGIGIKEEDLDTIFEPFERINTRRNRDVAGTGLGLPIVKNLVTLMDGTIGVTSQYGMGSTFSVSLPLIAGTKTVVNEEEPRKSDNFEDLKVLVVDDNPVNLNVAKGLLRALHSIDCDTAASGMDAIAKIRCTDYDIVFMDHMMPDMDGIDTTVQIREMGEKYKKLPIIALTANATADARELLLHSGMNDFLGKPISRTDLQDVLNKWAPAESKVNSTNDIVESEDDSKETSIFDDKRLLKLNNVIGLDIKLGLENIGLDIDMYLQTLSLLLKKIANVTPIISEALEKSDMPTLQAEMHGLKGAFSSVGADFLSSRASSFEAAAKKNEEAYCKFELPVFIMDIIAFEKSLSDALPEKENVSTTNSSHDKTSYQNGPLLEILIDALETFDYDQINEALNNALANEWAEAEIVQLQQAKDCIDAFEYTKAKSIIDQIK